MIEQGGRANNDQQDGPPGRAEFYAFFGGERSRLRGGIDFARFSHGAALPPEAEILIFYWSNI